MASDSGKKSNASHSHIGRREILRDIRRLDKSKKTRPWSKKDREYLEKNFLVFPYEEIAKNLKRTKFDVYCKIGSLKLKSRLDDYISSCLKHDDGSIREVLDDETLSFSGKMELIKLFVRWDKKFKFPPKSVND